MEKTPFRTATGKLIEICDGDCFEGMDGLAAESIDLVVTSPPYNIGVKYGAYDDTMPREQYLDWIAEWAGKVARVLSPEGSLFLNVAGKPSDPWVALDVARVVADRPEAGGRARRFQLQNTFHWVKSITIDREEMQRAGRDAEALSVGHFKPINSQRFVNDCHEYIFHFTHAGKAELDRLAIGVPYQDKSNIGRWKQAQSDLRCRGNTWFLPYETILSAEKERPHPATFPTKLPEWCMRLHGLERINRCMDPFLGIGSSAVAAARLDVPFVGFELDSGYYAEAVARVREALRDGREGAA